MAYYSCILELSEANLPCLVLDVQLCLYEKIFNGVLLFYPHPENFCKVLESLVKELPTNGAAIWIY